MKALQIRKVSILVQCSNGDITAVARYNDENGAYFLNQNLEKQYAVIEAKKIIRKSRLQSFTFDVSYWISDRLHSTQKTIKAINFDTAYNRCEKSYKNIYDISC